jgi:carnitine O-acetyltransferase
MKTFENQSKLPRLPIPPLSHLSKTYIRSVEPYLSPEELSSYKGVVEDFVNGFGKKLQQRLIEYDATQKYSWLEEWWYTYAYLSWRSSVLVNSNWYVLAQPYKNQLVPAVVEGYSAVQIERAAGFTSCFLDYKALIDR